jgi:hypothetical protein
MVDELTVRWPRSGRVQRFRDLPADRFLRVFEGRGELIEVGPRKAPRVPALGPDFVAEEPVQPAPPADRTGG